MGSGRGKENFLSLDSFGFRRTSVVAHSLGPRLAFLSSPEPLVRPWGWHEDAHPLHAPRSGYSRIDVSPEAQLGSSNAERETALGLLLDQMLPRNFWCLYSNHPRPFSRLVTSAS